MLVGSEEKFILTMQNLAKVINYRIEMKTYYEKLLNDASEKNLDNLTRNLIEDIEKKEEKLSLSDVDDLAGFH